MGSVVELLLLGVHVRYMWPARAVVHAVVHAVGMCLGARLGKGHYTTEINRRSGVEVEDPVSC